MAEAKVNKNESKMQVLQDVSLSFVLAVTAVQVFKHHKEDNQSSKSHSTPIQGHLQQASISHLQHWESCQLDQLYE
jgi:hypothetical protein